MKRTHFETAPKAALQALINAEGQRVLLPESLHDKALAKIAANAPKIRAALGPYTLPGKMWDINADALNALITDYCRALFGLFEPTATHEQIKRLFPVKDSEAADIDLFGLREGVLEIYSSIWKRCQYLDNLSDKNIDKGERVLLQNTETRKLTDTEKEMLTLLHYDEAEDEGIDYTEEAVLYINGPATVADARAAIYLNRLGLLLPKVERAAGAKQALGFLARCRRLADRADYINCYIICKMVFEADEVTLESIRKPEDVEGLGSLTWKQIADREVNIMLTRPKYLRTLADKDDEDDKTADRCMQISSNVSGLLSRDLYGTTATDLDVAFRTSTIFPIPKLIDDWYNDPANKDKFTIEQNGSYKVLPASIFATTLEGLYRLALLKRAPSMNGLVGVNYTDQELAVGCGYDSPNSEVKADLMLAVQMMNDFKLLARIKRNYNLLISLATTPATVVTDQGKTKGALTFIPDALFNGKQQFYPSSLLQKIDKAFIGPAGKRFKYIIMHCENLAKGELRERVFANNAKLEAEALRFRGKPTDTEEDRKVLEKQRDEAVKRLKNNQRKNRPKQDHKIAEMFIVGQYIGFIESFEYNEKWKDTEVARWRKPSKKKMLEDETSASPQRPKKKKKAGTKKVKKI